MKVETVQVSGSRLRGWFHTRVRFDADDYNSPIADELCLTLSRTDEEIPAWKIDPLKRGRAIVTRAIWTAITSTYCNLEITWMLTPYENDVTGDDCRVCDRPHDGREHNGAHDLKRLPDGSTIDNGKEHVCWKCSRWYADVRKREGNVYQMDARQ